MSDNDAILGQTQSASAAFIRTRLIALGLLAPNDDAPMQPLTGGVSSDIWRVDLPSGPVAVKRALARLKVSAVWEAPIERNAYEVAWMRVAARIAPGAAPKVLAHDEASGLFVMAFLDPLRYPLWKTALREGRADPKFAATIGETLAAIHAGSANDANIAARFATDAIFYSIRLEPYLLATARRHSDCAAALQRLVEVTRTTKRALVHGDVSPKNILIDQHGPIFLDAECAWYGDPAFDLAFCLNHLLLKCLWTPSARDRFLTCFDELAQSYLTGVTWEPRAEIDARSARLLPGLLLARVDGKSPVEYVTDEGDKDKVRRAAKPLLLEPADTLAAVRQAWANILR